MANEHEPTDRVHEKAAADVREWLRLAVEQGIPPNRAAAAVTVTALHTLVSLIAADQKCDVPQAAALLSAVVLDLERQLNEEVAQALRGLS